MSKNFAKLYATGNDASALEQKFFLKKETARGVLVAPAGTDFLYQLAGGALNFARPHEASPVRSGRHNRTGIQGKDDTTWSFPTFFMIDSTKVSADVTEIDQAMRTLMTSLLGVESAGAPLTYTPTSQPDITFSLFQNGDVWARQAPGCFVEACNMTFPGDGRSQAAWSGSGKTVYNAGIAKSTVLNTGGTTVTVQTGEAARFDVGAMVMIVKSDGTTRSTDTPDTTPRTITGISGDVITLNGASLTDADGSSNAVYLCYYEPSSPAAINDPATGLVGTATVAGLSSAAIRSFGVNITNNHEKQNYYWGVRGLGGSLFTAGGRLNVEVTMELNMSHKLLAFVNGLKSFAGCAITFDQGDTTSRYMEITLPKVIFGIPEIPVPETGSIPVTLTGIAYESGDDTADEISVAFK